MKLRAPAKINLGLRVLGRRSDGYHEVRTTMVGISLYDEIEVTVSSQRGLSLECDVDGVPVDGRNLVIRAAVEFFQETGIEPRAHFRLRKRIPWGAGLGGGSSDAAAALLALDGLYGMRLGESGLEKLGARVGSDVPWFIGCRPAVCLGRGERVVPIEGGLGGMRILLVKPPFGISTAWAYGRWSEMGPVPQAALLWGVLDIVNELEVPVFQKYILLEVLKGWLMRQSGVEAAAMSGSGSTVYAILSGAADAERVASAVREEFGPTFATFCVETLDRRPEE